MRDGDSSLAARRTLYTRSGLSFHIWMGDSFRLLSARLASLLSITKQNPPSASRTVIQSVLRMTCNGRGQLSSSPPGADSTSAPEPETTGQQLYPVAIHWPTFGRGMDEEIRLALRSGRPPPCSSAPGRCCRRLRNSAFMRLWNAAGVTCKCTVLPGR